MLEIITDEKGILLKNGRTDKRRAINALDYTLNRDQTLTIFNLASRTVEHTGPVEEIILNGESLTLSNFDEKLKEVFFLDESGGGGGLTPEQAAKLNTIVTDGSGDKYLSDDGEYKDIDAMAEVKTEDTAHIHLSGVGSLVSPLKAEAVDLLEEVAPSIGLHGDKIATGLTDTHTYRSAHQVIKGANNKYYLHVGEEGLQYSRVLEWDRDNNVSTVSLQPENSAIAKIFEAVDGRLYHLFGINNGYPLRRMDYTTGLWETTGLITTNGENLHTLAHMMTHSDEKTYFISGFGEISVIDSLGQITSHKLSTTIRFRNLKYYNGYLYCTNQNSTFYKIDISDFTFSVIFTGRDAMLSLSNALVSITDTQFFLLKERNGMYYVNLELGQIAEIQVSPNLTIDGSVEIRNAIMHEGKIFINYRFVTYNPTVTGEYKVGLYDMELDTITDIAVGNFNMWNLLGDLYLVQSNNQNPQSMIYNTTTDTFDDIDLDLRGIIDCIDNEFWFLKQGSMSDTYTLGVDSHIYARKHQEWIPIDEQLAKADVIQTNGSATEFLAKDGQYHSISTPANTVQSEDVQSIKKMNIADYYDVSFTPEPGVLYLLS